MTPNRFTQFMDVIESKTKDWDRPLDVGISSYEGGVLVIRVWRGRTPERELIASAPFTPGQEQEAADDLARQLIAIFPTPPDYDEPD